VIKLKPGQAQATKWHKNKAHSVSGGKAWHEDKPQGRKSLPATTTRLLQKAL